jgi:anaerobic magnesium-protoporphyrin IX monomethyl ester cyclase
MVRVAFVQRNLNENLGVMILSACLRSGGHESACFIDAEEKDLISAVNGYKPDIIGFTVMSGMHAWCLKVAAKLKRSDNLILFGGAHATFFPKVILEDCVDVVCVGEGEGAIVELADAYPDREKIGRIRNLHVKRGGKVVENDVRPLIADLDALPRPDRELFYKYGPLRRNSRKTVLTSRGCPYGCTFCFNTAYRRLYEGKGCYVRFRSSDSVIGEILDIREKYGLKSVFFQDDTFILDKGRLFRLLDDYRKRVNLPFTCLIRADLVDEETVVALKEAGCACVQFGIESGVEEIRNGPLRKGVTDAQIIETARLLRKHGIRFKTYNILRLPHETIEDAFRTVEMNSRIRSDYPWASLLLPYPGTELTNYMIREGLLHGDYAVDDLPESFFNIENPTRGDWEFINLQRLFFWAVKFPSLSPVIRRLIRLPPNPIFDALFLASHAYNYMGSENMAPLDVVYFGMKSLRSVF